jgi:hypothetical protein
MHWGSGLRLMLLLLNGHRVEVGDGVVNKSVATVGRWSGAVGSSSPVCRSGSSFETDLGSSIEQDRIQQ